MQLYTYIRIHRKLASQRIWHNLKESQQPVAFLAFTFELWLLMPHPTHTHQAPDIYYEYIHQLFCFFWGPTFLSILFFFHFFFFSKILTGDFSASFFYFLFFMFYFLSFIFSLSNPLLLFIFSYSRYFMYVCMQVHISHKRVFSLHTHDIMGHDWFKLLYRCAVVCYMYVCMYVLLHT